MGAISEQRRENWGLLTYSALWCRALYIGNGRMTQWGRIIHFIKNARHSLRQAKQNEPDNPSTHVHKSVEYLQNVRDA